MIKCRTEAKFWGMLRDRVMKPYHHATRIESHATALGVPDLHINVNRKPMWVELKQANKGDKFELRPAQYRWICDELDAGDTPIHIVGCYDPLDDSRNSIIFNIRIYNKKIAKYLIEDGEIRNWMDAADYSISADAIRHHNFDKMLLGEIE